MKLVGLSSNSCTARYCTVVSEYQKKGIQFLLQAINHPTYLEDLTGLTGLKKSAGMMRQMTVTMMMMIVLKYNYLSTFFNCSHINMKAKQARSFFSITSDLPQRSRSPT